VTDATRRTPLPELSWRERLDRRSLRWQARLDTQQVDRLLPWLAALLLLAVLVALTAARYRSLLMGTDLAMSSQVVWLIGEGFVPDSTLLGENYLGIQAGFFIYPLAVVTKIFPINPTLLVLQSAALALGLVPLWRIARSVGNLRVGATAAIAFGYSIFAAVHTLNVADFHIEVFALPALLAAVLQGLRQKWISYWILIGFILMCRADLGLAIAGLGLLIGYETNRRMGVITAVVGFGWTAFAILVVQPLFLDGAFPHMLEFASYGSGNPFNVLWGIITHPHDFLSDLTSEENFGALVMLFAPVLFLPFVAPRYLLPAVPLFALYLVADVQPTGRLEEATQTIPIAAFVFVATVFALKRSGRVLVERVNVDKRLLLALVLTACVFFVLDSATSPYEQPWNWGRLDAADGARLDAVAIVPEAGAVRASPRLLPRLSERTRLYELVTDTADGRDSAPDAILDVEWIVLDLDAAPLWTDTLEQQRFALGLGPGWEQVYAQQGVFVYQFTGETL
jgi:uncharacterized membrane protein